MYFGVTEAFRKTVVDKLRLWIGGTEPIVQNFKYTSDEKTTKVQIFDKFPMDESFRPCIIVKTSSGNGTSEWSLGQFLDRFEDDGKIYDKYGGKVRFTATLAVESWTSPNAENLVDVLLVGLSDGGAVRGMLEQEGFIIEPDSFARLTSEYEKPIDNTKSIYGFTISLSILTNWKRIVERDLEKMEDSAPQLTNS